MASAPTSIGLLDDGVDRHLLAQVEHRVAVVGQDGVDQALADVVHVAVDGGQHDLALGLPLGLLQVRLQPRDGLLHHLRALQHEGEDQLARAELVAHLLHRGQQHLVEHLEAAAPSASLAPTPSPLPIARSTSSSTPVLLAVQDLPVQRLRRRPSPRSDRRPAPPRRDRALEVGDEGRERVVLRRAAVEDQVVGQPARLLGDLEVGASRAPG